MTSTNFSIHSPATLVEDDVFWKRHITSYKASGLTRTNYCRLHQVNYHRFGYWLKKSHTPASAFIAIEVKPEETVIKSTLLATLRLQDKHTLEIYDQQTLAFLLEKLR